MYDCEHGSVGSTPTWKNGFLVTGQCGVEFCHSTRNASRIRQKARYEVCDLKYLNGHRSVLFNTRFPDPLRIPCYVREAIKRGIL